MKISLIEDHHQALSVWRRLKFKDLTLAHIDAHRDFAFYPALALPEILKKAGTLKEVKKKLERTLLYQRYKGDLEDQLNIGNYIYPAMRDGIVKKFVWVAPAARKSGPCCDIFSVRSIEKPLLLDIDVDYLISGELSRRKPWIYPKGLSGLLRSKFPNPLCTTIAYSVNGGFTPLEYKFFGDELYLRLKEKQLDDNIEKIFSLRDQAIKVYFNDELSSCAKYLKEALRILENKQCLDVNFRERLFAHLYFWLFKSYWAMGKKGRAAEYYRQALKSDPTYRAKDNNCGWLYLNKGDLKSAYAEFRRILFCDPQDAYASVGIGEVYLRRKKYRLSGDGFKKALSIEAKNKEALFGLASLYLKIGRLKQAERVLRRIRKQALFNSRRYVLEAALGSKQGFPIKALKFYKKALLFGRVGVEAYADIFRILKKQRALPDLFLKGYQRLKGDFYVKRKKLLLKQRRINIFKQQDKVFKKIDVCIKESRGQRV